jgi:hypothetical protein
MKILIFGLSLLFGCTGYQYIAAPHYIPVDLEKGKLNANLSLNYYQLGYTLTDNFSIYTTGYYRDNKGGIFKATAATKENGGAYIQTDKQKEFDFGMTFYKGLSNYLSYEIISGVGIGSVEYTNTQDLFPDYNFSFSAKKLSFYVQPDLTFSIYKYFDFSIFSRINQSRYYGINKSLNLGAKSEPEKYDQYFNDREIVSLCFFEPGLQIRVGLDNIKFQFLYTRIFDLKNTGIQYRQNNLYLGLSLRLNLIKKR